MEKQIIHVVMLLRYIHWKMRISLNSWVVTVCFRALISSVLEKAIRIISHLMVKRLKFNI